MNRMKKIFQALFLFYILTLISCNSKEQINTRDIFEKSTLNDSLAFYFPPILNDTIKRRSQIYQNFKQKWYSSSLYSFKEPILYTKKDSQIIYRLLVLRSFHQPICFSIKEFEGDYFLNAKSLDRQPAFYPKIEGRFNDFGKEIVDTIQKADRLAFIKFDTLISLSNGQRNKIENYLAKLDFWNSPIADPFDEHTTDGSNWVIEGRKNNKYHFIDRRNARGELRQFGKYLIRLSGLKIKEDEIY